jgi:hypothetical protein
MLLASGALGACDGPLRGKGRRKARSSALHQFPPSNQGVTIAVKYDRNSSEKRLIGYARVSTYGQTLDAQLEQLRGAGCTKIYREKVTGAHNDRRELLKWSTPSLPATWRR